MTRAEIEEIREAVKRSHDIIDAAIEADSTDPLAEALVILESLDLELMAAKYDDERTPR